MSVPSYIELLNLNSIDLTDHHSLERDIFSLNVAFMTLITVVTGIRMSIRLVMIHAAGLDDWLMLLATLFTLLLSTFSLLGAHYGLGTHLYLLGPSLPIFLHKTTRITQCLYGCYLAYATAITLVKSSIIVSYLRIFPARSMRIFMYTTLVLVVMMWICSVFAIVFECVPVSAAWDWTEQGRCIDILKFFDVSSAFNIITDLTLLVAPLPVFWGMNMRRGERIIICGLFGFGLFACIASILRLAQLHGLHSRDITYTSVPSLNWSVAEVSTAILCACVPSMHPLASVLLPRVFKSSVSSKAPLSNKTSTPGVELNDPSAKSRKSKYGDEEEGDWEELSENRRDRLTESVDLEDILREGSEGTGELRLESPPQTPGTGTLEETEEKL